MNIWLIVFLIAPHRLSKLSTARVQHHTTANLTAARFVYNSLWRSDASARGPTRTRWFYRWDDWQPSSWVVPRWTFTRHTHDCVTSELCNVVYGSESLFVICGWPPRLLRWLIDSVVNFCLLSKGPLIGGNWGNQLPLFTVTFCTFVIAEWFHFHPHPPPPWPVIDDTSNFIEAQPRGTFLQPLARNFHFASTFHFQSLVVLEGGWNTFIGHHPLNSAPFKFRGVKRGLEGVSAYLSGTDLWLIIVPFLNRDTTRHHRESSGMKGCNLSFSRAS